MVNVTASRVSLKSERRMRLFQRDAYVSIDFQAGEATIARKGSGEMFPGVPDVRLERRRFEANDPLQLEIEAFLAAVRGERAVAVSRSRRASGARGRASDHPRVAAATLSEPPQGWARPDGSGWPSIQARMSSQTSLRSRSRSRRCQPLG